MRTWVLVRIGSDTWGRFIEADLNPVGLTRFRLVVGQQTVDVFLDGDENSVGFDFGTQGYYINTWTGEGDRPRFEADPGWQKMS